MPGKELESRIEALLEPEAGRHGMEVVAVELVGGRGAPTMRVFLDRPGGIDLDAITEANRWVSATLEADEPVKGAYTLEVSSPGIERPLRKLADFERFAGCEAALRTEEPIGGRSRFTGTIERVEGQEIVVTCGDDEFRLPLRSITKARLKPEIDFQRHEGEPT